MIKNKEQKVKLYLRVTRAVIDLPDPDSSPVFTSVQVEQETSLQTTHIQSPGIVSVILDCYYTGVAPVVQIH